MAVYRKSGTPVRHSAYCFSCKGYEANPPGYLGMSTTTATTENSRPTAIQTRGSSGILNKVQAYHAPAVTVAPPSQEDVLSEFKTYPIRKIVDRGLLLETCEHYGVRVSLSPTDGVSIITHMYPYFKEKKLCGYNERVVEGKRFFGKGDRKNVQLFGSQLPKRGKTLYITEGEIDAMSLYQALRANSTLTDYHPSVVSLAHGASSAVRDITNDFEYVDSFEKIVLVFDQDDPGQAAVKDVCQLLGGKIFIAHLTEKDPNALLMAGKGEALKWAVLTGARAYMPDNIVNYADAWDRYNSSRNQKCYYWPEAYSEMNRMTYGVRMGELIVVTSGTGMGKTQFMRELKYHYFMTTDHKIADIALEEDLGDSMKGMVALHLSKRITLPDVQVDPAAEEAAFRTLFKGERWTGYDFFGGMDDETLFSKLRWMAAKGHKFIFLDHLSIIISEFADQGDERQRIDSIMTKLARMCKELDIVIFIVVHLKKTTGFQVPFEKGAVPSLDDLRGSGTLKQLPMTIIALSRNQQHRDPICANTSQITILKCRFTGRTGIAQHLYFQGDTGRMVVVPRPSNYIEEPEKPKSFGKGGY